MVLLRLGPVSSLVEKRCPSPWAVAPIPELSGVHFFKERPRLAIILFRLYQVPARIFAITPTLSSVPASPEAAGEPSSLRGPAPGDSTLRLWQRSPPLCAENTHGVEIFSEIETALGARLFPSAWPALAGNLPRRAVPHHDSSPHTPASTHYARCPGSVPGPFRMRQWMRCNTRPPVSARRCSGENIPAIAQQSCDDLRSGGRRQADGVFIGGAGFFPVLLVVQPFGRPV